MKSRVIAFSLVSAVFFSLLLTENTALSAAAASSDEGRYGEHIRCVDDVAGSPMQIEVLDPASGQSAFKSVPGSDYIPVGSTDYIQIVCGAEPDSGELSGGEFYVYFYDQDREPLWDILDHTDESTGERNRVSVDYLRELNGFQFTGVPDGSYIRIAKANDHACRLLIWDGCKTGYPITGVTTVFNEKNEKERLPADGTACILVPITAVYVIAKPGYTFLGMTTSNSSVSEGAPSPDCRFPAQLVSLRGFEGADRAKNLRIASDYDYDTGEYGRVMPNGDLSDAVIALDESDFQPSTSAIDRMNPIYRNIQACMDFTWEATTDIHDNLESSRKNGIAGIFTKGVTYHGIPYRNSWRMATSVGWHVSKQTFMNAANDPDSIFYHYGEVLKGPYYSLVCSSFGTLVSGFAYPMTNYSMTKDPNLLVEQVDAPVIGSLMSNGTSHCFIPIELSVDPDGASVLTLAEQITPITAMRNVYEGIPKSWQGIGLKSSYTASYIYCVSPAEFSDIPYDITTYTIKNGSARPHRGDQSVYTSGMDVLINIKDPEATRLYFQRFDVTCSHGIPVRVSPSGKASYAQIKPGTKQVVLRSATAEDGSFTGAALENGAVYGVWASKGAQQRRPPSNTELFEWYDLASEKITYTVKDGALVTDDVFWYAITKASNSEKDAIRNQMGGTCSIPYQAPAQSAGEEDAHSDYSNYAERARIPSPSAVKSFFRKGKFGAYVTAKEVVDG